MADELGQSVFTEVLEVQVDLPVFQRGLAALEQEYRAFIQRIGELGVTPQNVIDTGSVGQMARSVQELTTQMDSIRNGFIRVMSDTREQINETLTTLNDNMRRIVRPGAGSGGTGEDEQTSQHQAVLDQLTAQWDAHLQKKQALQQKYDEAVATGNDREASYFAGKLQQMEQSEIGFRERIARIRATQEEKDRAGAERQQAELNRIREQGARAYAQYMEQQHAEALRMDAQRTSEIERQEAEIRRIRELSARAYTQYIETQHAEALRMDAARTREVATQEAELNRIRMQGARAYAQYLDAQHAEAIREDRERTAQLEAEQQKRQRLLDAGRLNYNAAYREANPNDATKGAGSPANQNPLQATITAEERAYTQHFTRLQVIKQKFEEATRLGDKQAQVFWQARWDSAVGVYKQAFERMEAQNAGFFERFLGRITKNFPEFIAQILKYTIGFQLLFGTISAIQNAFGAVINSFKTGIEFLSQIQERTADIKEALLENVVYSRDWATNVQLAGQAAQAASYQITNLAARFAIPPEKIEAAFKSLTQSGGLKLLNGDINQAISLSGTLLSLMRSAGVTETNQRRAITEISNLMTGQVKDSSVLLKVLGLTTEQWKKIREEASKTGDLLGAHINAHQTVRDRLEAANDRLATASQRWKDLLASVQTYAQMLLGTMAKGVFESLLTSLQKIKEYYETHKEQLHAIALTIGNIAKVFVELAKTLLTLAGGGTGILTFFARMALYASETAAALTESVYQLSLFAPGHTPTGFEPRKEGEGYFAFESRKNAALKKEETDHQKEWEDRKKNFEKISADITALEAGKIPDDLKKSLEDIEKLPNIIDFILKPTSDDKAGPNDRLATIKSEFTSALTDIQNTYREKLDAIDRDLANNTISHEEWLKRRRTALLLEGDTIAGLKDKYQELAQADKTATNRAKTRTVASIGQQADKAINTSDERARQDEIDFIKKVEKDRKDAADFKVKIAKQASDEYLKALKAEVQEGTLLESEYLDRQRKQIELTAEAQRKLLEEEKGRTNDEFEKRRIDRELQQLDINRTEALRENTNLRIAAMRKETEEARRHADAMRAIANESRIEDLQRNQRRSGNPYTQQQTSGQILQVRNQELLVQLRQLNAEIALAQAMGLTGKALDDLIEKATKLTEEIKKGQQDAQDNSPEGKAQVPTRQTDNAWSTIFGEQVQSWDDVKERMHSFSGVVDLAATAMKTLPGIIGGIVQGFKSGGVAGGIGSIMSTVGSFIPGPVGAVLSIGGGILSSIAGMFTAAARKIAEQIKKDIKRITDQYSLGQIGLADTIQQLEAKRNEAIRRLSGKKGGKKELQKILDDLDPQIAQLKKQQQDVIKTFEDQLTQLQVHDKDLRNFLQTWMDINKQVKEYIDAGGDLAKAQQFLSAQLKDIRDDAASNLRQGEQQAIQDAIKLNDLLKQRKQLIDDFNKKQFDLVNADAIERRGSGAVSRGMELAQARKDFQDQLSDLDQQIALQTQTVNKERTVFAIASDISALHQRDNELTLMSLDEQISKWQSLKTIVSSIFTDPATGLTKIYGSFLNQLGLATGTGTGAIQYGANYSMTPAQYAASLGYSGSLLASQTKYFTDNPQYLPTNNTSNVYTINVQVDATGQPNPTAIAGSISDEIQRIMRYGNYSKDL